MCVFTKSNIVIFYLSSNRVLLVLLFSVSPTCFRYYRKTAKNIELSPMLLFCLYWFFLYGKFYSLSNVDLNCIFHYILSSDVINDHLSTFTVSLWQKYSFKYLKKKTHNMRNFGQYTKKVNEQMFRDNTDWWASRQTNPKNSHTILRNVRLYNF